MDESFFKTLFDDKEENKIDYMKFFLISHRYHITLYKFAVWPFIFLVTALVLAALVFSVPDALKYGWDRLYGLSNIMSLVTLGLLAAVWVGLGIEPYKREQEKLNTSNVMDQLSAEELESWVFHENGEPEVLIMLEHFLRGNDFISGLYASFANRGNATKVFVGDFIRVNWRGASDNQTRDYLTYIMLADLDKDFEQEIMVGPKDSLRGIETHLNINIPELLKPHLRRLRLRNGNALIELSERVPIPENKLTLAKYFLGQV
jgi:hypothetical protein